MLYNIVYCIEQSFIKNLVLHLDMSGIMNQHKLFRLYSVYFVFSPALSRHVWHYEPAQTLQTIFSLFCV